MSGSTLGAAPERAPESAGVNQQVADKLRQAADLLAQQGANPFRVSAYRRAANAITAQRQHLRDASASCGVARRSATRAVPGPAQSRLNQVDAVRARVW